MERAWGYLERLSRYPHRGVGTPEEAAAAGEAAGWLRDLGYEVEVQPFRAPRDTLYLGPVVIMVGLMAGGFVGTWVPWLGLALCLMILAPLVGEMMGGRLDLDLLLRKVSSQNVVARSAPQGDERITLVISGHLDTQHATWLFHPRFVRYIQPYFNLVYGSIILIPVGLVGRWFSPGSAWSQWVLVAGMVLLVLHMAFLLICALSGGFINGANDNGTGAAMVLALAEQYARKPIPGVRFIFLLTGAEEVGTRGMKHYIRTERHDPGSTYFINLDNLGGGRLHYLQGEGMVVYHRFGATLVGLAQKMATEQEGRVSARKNLLLPTDGMIPAVAGYQAISFLAFQDDGSLPNYHWYTDTLENVDRSLLAFTERFMVEYVGRLAGEREPVA